MSNVRKGHVTVSGEWAKHLRWFGKKLFWRKHRRRERLDLRRIRLTPKEAEQ